LNAVGFEPQVANHPSKKGLPEDLSFNKFQESTLKLVQDKRKMMKQAQLKPP